MQSKKKSSYKFKNNKKRNTLNKRELILKNNSKLRNFNSPVLMNFHSNNKIKTRKLNWVKLKNKLKKGIQRNKNKKIKI